ncbi:MAG: preprotein translocase subunit SecG [Alphaproteobacteria bacterium]
MTALLFLVNALVALGLIILILLQRADTGAGGAFGGGGAIQPVIRNPLAKPTAFLAGIFLLTSLLIAYTQQGAGHHASVVEEGAEALPEATLPAAELPISLEGANGSSLPAPELPAVAPAAAVAASPTETSVAP